MPGHQPQLHAGILEHRQRRGAVVDEGGRRLLMRLRQRHPGLDAGQAVRRRAATAGRALRMHDAAAGGHPVHVARRDRQFGAEAVPVQDLALEQVGDGGQADMRVRPDIDAGAGQELPGSHLVEEDEGADHLAFPGRQGPPHLEAADVVGARQQHGLEAGRQRVVRVEDGGHGAVSRLGDGRQMGRPPPLRESCAGMTAIRKADQAARGMPRGRPAPSV
jgi:hypothetical protein